MAKSWRCGHDACSSSAPISSAPRSRPERSRCASFRRPTTSRPCTSCRRACSPTPRNAEPYRGAGRPEAAYFTERLIEHAARTIGIEPAEIRRRNLIPPAKLPYATPTLWTYDSGEFQRLMDKCIELSDWKGFSARKKASEKNGKLRGRAVSYYIEFGGIFNERMDLRFDPGGALTVLGGTHSHGQGHATVFAQLRARIPRRADGVDPLRAGRHRRGADRPRHLCRPQRHRRRQRAQGRERGDHRQGQATGRNA